MIVGLEGTGNDETSPGDRIGSGCRLGVRRRERLSGYSRADDASDLVLGAVNE